MDDKSELRDEFAEQLPDTEEAVPSMEEEESSLVTQDTETSPGTGSGLKIAPVRMTSEVGEDGQKKVPGIKIIGLSSELKRAMTGEESSEEEAEEESEVEDAEEVREVEEVEEVEEDTDESSIIETPTLKTPKVTIRKVAQVSTPGSEAAVSLTPGGKKRGRPSGAANLAAKGPPPGVPNISSFLVSPLSSPSNEH